MSHKVELIAEVKTGSPFGYESNKSWDELFELAARVGDIISIHTDARWGGSFDLVRKARALTKKPILAKGIHETDGQIQQALDAGADFVLVVGRLPGIHFEKCFIEPNTIDELRRLPTRAKAVWNSRDLSTGGLKKETFDEARKAFAGWLCQASNICDKGDMDSRADAVLVGSNLKKFSDSWL